VSGHLPWETGYDPETISASCRLYENAATKYLLIHEGAWGCFSSGIERFRRWQRIRLHVQRSISVGASSLRIQVQDRRSTQDAAAHAAKECRAELQQYQVGHDKHRSKPSFYRYY